MFSGVVLMTMVLECRQAVGLCKRTVDFDDLVK